MPYPVVIEADRRIVVARPASVVVWIASGLGTPVC